jgi:hypothetical protein
MMKQMSPSLQILCAFTILVICSCSGGLDVAGRYEASNPSGGPPLMLELKNDGNGSWSIAKEEVAFAWEPADSAVLLHSKSGGVITGQLRSDGSIEINMPGVGEFRFLRVRN